MGEEIHLGTGGGPMAKPVSAGSSGSETQVVDSGDSHGLDPISIIDAEIHELQQEQDRETIENIDIPPELYQTAENLFGGSMVDPNRENKMVKQLVEFAIGEQGVQGPAELLNWFMKINQQMKPEFPRHDMLSRAWFGMQKMKVRAAQTAMQHGP